MSSSHLHRPLEQIAEDGNVTALASGRCHARQAHPLRKSHLYREPLSLWASARCRPVRGTDQPVTRPLRYLCDELANDGVKKQVTALQQGAETCTGHPHGPEVIQS
ncbi:hypothetical protein NDU88_003558 [Pleurodeles waltl]|uniref:Uncharacterized protein n=1 Tax=Pleurodeles waltl TaxID=8319 RepID=A0AAV7TPY8_PLEWA|nr:hypothetical protein NDU88_003558 [Pleurodeles waltl]